MPRHLRRSHTTPHATPLHEMMLELPDGSTISFTELLTANPDMIIECVHTSSLTDDESHPRLRPKRRFRFPRMKSLLLTGLLLLLLTIPVSPTYAAPKPSSHAIPPSQDVCDHHVTSGLLRNLVNRGMAKAFFYGFTADDRIYGILVLWNPSCQRALFSVYRTGPNGNTFNHVTHYYLSGAKGTSIRSAIAAARARVAATVVGGVRSGPVSMPFRAVPRSLDSPGFRPPNKVRLGEGGGGPQSGSGVGGGIRRNDQD